MLDQGLLLSAAAVFVVLLLFGRARRDDEPPLSEAAFWPAVVGLVVGRLVALGLEDPAGLRAARNLFLVRGGVELWPGVAAGTIAALVLVRRQRASVGSLARVLVPSAVAAWATYDVACLIRDGCPGPASSWGLRPPGLETSQLPVSAAAGLFGLTAAAALRATATRRPAGWLALAALLVVSGLRSIESIWLPSLSDGLSRQRTESLVVLVASAAAMLLFTGRRAWASHRRRSKAQATEGRLSLRGDLDPAQNNDNESLRPPPARTMEGGEPGRQGVGDKVPAAPSSRQLEGW